MRTLVLLVCLGQCVWFAGCGSSEQSSSATPPGAGGGGGGGVAGAQVQGNWYITLSSTSIPHGTGEVNLFINQSGKNLSASAAQAVDFTGSWCDQGGGFMTGTLTGNSLTFAFHTPTGFQLTFTGALANGVLTGTYSTTGSCGREDAGSFMGQVSPSITGNSWTGTATFLHGSADFTADLTEGATGLVTGSISFPSGSPCGTTMNVNGGHKGRVIYLVDNQGLKMDLVAVLDQPGKTISGEGGIMSPSVCDLQGLTMSKN